jgi:trans-aconitate 2-methyltransferase
MTDWDPELHARYKSQRDRPALDLLLQIPMDLYPGEIWDLGCGTGEYAALLAARHPSACVRALDSSPAKLEVARRRPAPVDWRLGDIAAFAPEIAPDLIFTNAVLQRVPDHRRLLPALVQSLAPGGVLACQIPVESSGEWRAQLKRTAAEPRWAAALKGVEHPAIADPSDYYDWLSPLCAGGLDIWTTEYLHELEGEDPVLEWTRGSSLRPCLDALAPDDAQTFEALFSARLREAYPARADGITLLPFARLFIVARR